MASDPIQKRIVGLFCSCLLLAALLLGRAALIQLGSDPRLDQMARRQFQSRTLIRPSRGEILDRDGDALAINSESSSLAMNPSRIRDPRRLARLVSRALNISYAKILARMRDRREFGWIKRHLSDAELVRLRRWHLYDDDGDLLAGLWMVRESRRVYPHGQLAAHVLGDVNLDTEGTEGVELWMDSRLKGKVTSMTAVRDALGRPAFYDESTKSGSEGRDGEPVTLTLDSSLQFAVEEELRSAVRKAGARGGTVIVMNAVTGELLAMANEPTFNPNDHARQPDRRRNRALTDGYEPGSTLKPVLLAAALSHGMKLTDQIWGEHGHFVVQGRRISEAEAHEQFEWLSLRKIIQVSSNVGAAKLALKVGADRYYAELKAFGFGARTGLDFPGEISGRIPPRRAWKPLTLANLGFGQGLLVTPLQMTRAYAAFVNGGYLVEPTLIRDPVLKPQEAHPIMAPAVAAQVVQALRSVTDKEGGGTGAKAVLPGYLVAGKTGTAQKVDPQTGAYSRSKYVASFIGFPLNVEPKLVIFASIDEPHGVYYGGEVAAPLFREVLNAAANRFGMPSIPQEGPAPLLASGANPGPGRASEAGALPAAPMDRLRLSQADARPPAAADGDGPVRSGEGETQGDSGATGPGASTGAADDLRGEPSLTMPGKPGDPALPGMALARVGRNADGKTLWQLPSLKGLTAREVIEILQGHSFRLELHGTGFVRSQSPEEGKEVADGGAVRVNLAEQ